MARNDLQPYPVNITLAVIQQDIDFGIAQDSASCAIAHAIYRTFPNALRVRVNRKTISWSDADTDVRYIYPTPPIADSKIIKPFDTGDGEAQPTRFTLSGGKFRSVDHKQSRSRARERARARIQKREDPDAYANRSKHPNFNYPEGQQGPRGSSRLYDRYVPERKDL